jgi:hypothetical protein
MIQDEQLLNYVGGKWQRPRNATMIDVRNPATAETLVQVPLTSSEEVDVAVQAAQGAFPAWKRTPSTDRIQYLFKFKQLLEEHFDEIARLTTQECGKTLAESQGELRRGIENVEVACGIPSMMMGYNVEDIARGIDEHMLRQPVGVVAAITPFNFPSMIPLWFLPYAIACGNCSTSWNSRRALSVWSMVGARRSMRCWIIHWCAAFRLWVLRQWQSISIAGQQQTANAHSVREARKTQSLSCQMPIWR